jgi:hypothetical protein
VKLTVDRAADSGRDFDLEHRLLMPDGSVRCIHVFARAVRDKAGQPEFNGALMEVTAVKRAEEELRDTSTFKNVDQEMASNEFTKLVRDMLKLMLGELRANRASVQTTLDAAVCKRQSNSIAAGHHQSD